MKGYSPSSMNKLPEKLDVLVKIGCDIDCLIHLSEEVVNFGLENVKDKEKCVEIIELKVKESLRIGGGSCQTHHQIKKSLKNFCNIKNNS